MEKEKVEKIIEEKINPLLKPLGVSCYLEVVDVQEKEIKLALNCPASLSSIPFKVGGKIVQVEEEIKKNAIRYLTAEFPESKITFV